MKWIKYTKIDGIDLVVEPMYFPPQGMHFSSYTTLRNVFVKENIPIRIYRKSTTLGALLRPVLNQGKGCKWTDCPTCSKGTCFVRNVVYELKCIPCGGKYIGSTTRSLHERIRDHTWRGSGSNVLSHLRQCSRGRINVDVTIISREKDAINAGLAESLAIRERKPSLNGRDENGLVSLIVWSP